MKRKFLKASALGATGLTASFSVTQKALGDAKGDDEPLPETAYRTLGRTGMKVSIVGWGGVQVFEPALLQAGFDRGINYIDTGRIYRNGRSEKVLGGAASILTKEDQSIGYSFVD